MADDVSSLTGQEPGGTIRSTPVISVFAGPRIVMREREDGCLLLRSADLLQDYPGTVVHSLRAWAVADPDYPLVAERDADGSWRACSYGAAVADDAPGMAVPGRRAAGDRRLAAVESYLRR
jgi:hypothetical protein